MRWQTLARQIGKNMKMVRRTGRLTQERAAEKAGISLRYWQQLEAGEKNMTLKALTAICRALEVEIKEIIKN